MKDQAQQLRDLVKSYEKAKIPKRAKVITVLSGKGGVGKSVVSVNLAVSLSRAKKKVLLLDTDVGFANADIILGITSPYHLIDVIKGRKTLEEVMVDGPEGVFMIAGGSIIPDLGTLSLEEIDKISRQFSGLEAKMDYIIIDSSAGLSPVILNFIKSSDELVVVTNPEPPAIADAYCITKSIFRHNARAKVNFIINRTVGQKEGQQAAKRLQYSIKKFLNQEVKVLGLIEEDQKVALAVRKQTPFSILYPYCTASKNLQAITLKIIEQKNERNETDKNLFQRILSFLST